MSAVNLYQDENDAQNKMQSEFDKKQKIISMVLHVTEQQLQG